MDYFFRGKLDVDLVEDPFDSAQFQLVGTNGSSETLVDGKLTLYADDQSGTRSQVSGVISLPVQGVAQGRDLFTVPPSFLPPADAERFVAVYKGRLGEEVPVPNENPQLDFPGGVIGKVVGGIRVEEVFADGANWKLRTPKGVFLLKDGARPLTVAEFEEVRWGDGDNLLVARTPFGQEQANRVVAYDLQRQPGSAEVVTTPDGLEVVLDRKAAAGFPFGIPVGVAGQFDRTQVDFLQTVQYQQHQATYTRTDVFQWVAEGGFYKFARSDVGPLEITQPVSQTVSSAAGFPLVLDLAHNINGMGFGTAIEPYQWFLSEVGVDASGRLLGLVAVFFSGPGHREALAPAVVVDPDAGPQVTGQASVSPFAPFVPHEALLLWALVDLQAGRVIASTAESLIRMATHEAQEGRLVVAVDLTVVFQGGGPQDGTEHVGWREDLGPSVWEESGDPTDIQTQGLFPGGSWLGFSIGGDYRAEFKEALEGLGLLTAGVHPIGETTHLAPYACEETGREFLACRSIRLTAPVTRIGRAGQLEDARRARPAPGSERLVFLVTWGTLLTWDPGAARAQVVLHEPLMEGFSLGPVTGSVVMFAPYSVETFEPSTFLVPLDGAQAPTVHPGEDLRTDFTLLAPSFLYNAQDLKFYRSKPPLQRTALPAKLADLPDKSNPVGDYHAIRLP
ncbi:MAG: hypothetical protein HYU24_15580 [Candidatus Rokubacteria bacterium]|nr:hypothetical protein [Candidatus Rokubacteria bacterium]